MGKMLLSRQEPCKGVIQRGKNGRHFNSNNTSAGTDLYHVKGQIEIFHNYDYCCIYSFLFGHIATRLCSRLIL